MGHLILATYFKVQGCSSYFRRAIGAKPRARMVETREGTQTKKIEVSNSTNSKPPQFNGKKGDAWTMWRMKYEADQGMKGFLEALQPKLASKLPMTEEAELDL